MTIAHTRTRRAYTRVHLRERDNEASVGLVVRVEWGRGSSHYKQYKRRTGVRGGQSKNEGSEKDSTTAVGHHRRSKGGVGGSEEGKEGGEQVADLSPRPRHLCHAETHSSNVFRVRSRSADRPTKRRYSSNVMSSRVG